MLGTAMHVTGLGDGAVLYGRYLPISITCASGRAKNETTNELHNSPSIFAQDLCGCHSCGCQNRMSYDRHPQPSCRAEAVRTTWAYFNIS